MEFENLFYIGAFVFCILFIIGGTYLDIEHNKIAKEHCELIGYHGYSIYGSVLANKFSCYNINETTKQRFTNLTKEIYFNDLLE